MVSKLKRMVDRLFGGGPAEDVEPDPNVANSRPTGEGRSESGDAPSTTGTGATGGYVGQVAGHDEGFAGETGAEACGTPDGDDPDRPR
ncbi:hypothetical protein [Pseudonocardia parietis]|uniref:Antitoxin protein of toxin-antitoxin system n=1 Tax=Pseudonocardia parietis TaxID=570936 RepID=A0ABS4VVG9_9PSEU|nr:hypothetical protein [Pseudonocardia parietis]MBP2367918.1 hypothetical protein [Pseudonocardia parietis]